MSAALLEQHLASVARLAPLIAEHAADAERERRLPQPIVRAMTEAGLFRLYVPHSLGGSQLSPLEFAEILESLSRIDGSTGWCAFIGNVNTLFTTPMLPAAIERIFLDQPGTVTGSAFFPFGRAVRADGGFRLSGRWQFASGCQHCRWYFVLCQEYEGGAPQFSASGVPLTRACFLPLEAYTIEETWDVSGLSGSGSHDVILDDVFVPIDMTWIFGRSMRPDPKHFGAPMYRHPPYATGVMQAGFIGIGIAQGAIDHALEIAQTKLGVGTSTPLRERPTFHIGLADAVALVRGSRAWLKEALAEFEQAVLAGQEVPYESRANMMLAATKAMHNSARATDIVYSLCGANANYRKNPLQRALRDVHAATQHFAVAINQVESAGRMMVGLEPLAPPVILG
ncbi:MAG: acyl-CoA dehydrogenase family protein [Gammaproteobacteria bacterium]